MSKQLEIWDLYDEQRRPLGQTVVRGQAHPAGSYHIVVAVWVRDSEGNLLITLRHPQKKQYPGLWENPGGSAQKGESSPAAALRELWEETGLRVEPDRLRLLGSSLEKTAAVDVYGVQLTERTPPVRLQPGETVDYRWVTPAELAEFAAPERFSGASLARKAALGAEFERFCRGTE